MPGRRRRLANGVGMVGTQAHHTPDPGPPESRLLRAGGSFRGVNEAGSFHNFRARLCQDSTVRGPPPGTGDCGLQGRTEHRWPRDRAGGSASVAPEASGPWKPGNCFLPSRQLQPLGRRGLGGGFWGGTRRPALLGGPEGGLHQRVGKATPREWVGWGEPGVPPLPQGTGRAGFSLRRVSQGFLPAPGSRPPCPPGASPEAWGQEGTSQGHHRAGNSWGLSAPAPPALLVSPRDRLSVPGCRPLAQESQQELPHSTATRRHRSPSHAARGALGSQAASSPEGQARLSWDACVLPECALAGLRGRASRDSAEALAPHFRGSQRRGREARASSHSGMCAALSWERGL